LEIERIDVYRSSLIYREPFRIALGTTTKSENIIVRIATDFNVEGWGEASPSFRITGETPETVVEALDKIGPKIIGMCPFRIEQIIETMDALVMGNSSAKAATDMAIFDIIGKRAKKPVCMLLGGYRNDVFTDITLSIKSPRQMARDAAKAVKKGFKALKVKVGVNPRQDVERVKRIREAVGSEIAIRVDANQGWKVRQAINTLKKLEPYNVEFVEQPVKAEDIKGLTKVRRNSSIPVMADETVHSPEDTIKVIHAEAVDLINIKLMKSGGIWKATKIAAIAEAAKIPCMAGCMGESNLGITAATHFAAAVKNVQHADLDSDLLLLDKLVKRGGAKVQGSKRILPKRSGLGITALNDKLLGKPLRTYK
jgi:L-alanine-DL-glutamate epimerase-like enolase superfamily enzyme